MTPANLPQHSAHVDLDAIVDGLPYPRPTAELDEPLPLASATRIMRDRSTQGYIDPRALLWERALLAANDPAGEAEASSPWTPVQARQILLEIVELELASPKARRRVAEYLVGGGRQRSNDEILAKLETEPAASQGMVCCPAHEDEHRSLSWKVVGDRLLLHCFAGCTFREILEAAA